MITFLYLQININRVLQCRSVKVNYRDYLVELLTNLDAIKTILAESERKYE